jgi:hypothetical protein
MVTVEDVRAVVRSLPRTEEHLIRDRVKFRVGRIVYVAFSRDERTMGVAFRDARAGRPGLAMVVPVRVAEAHLGSR